MEALSHRYEQYWTYLYYTYLSDDPLPSFLVGKHPSPRDWKSQKAKAALAAARAAAGYAYKDVQYRNDRAVAGRLLAVLVALIISVGLPLGYLTLRVYRATLPYDSIAEMQSQHIELTAKLAIVGLEDVKDDSIVASIKSQMVATLALHGVNGEVTTTTVDERFAITSPDTRTMKASVVTKFLGEHRCGSTTDRNGVAVDKQIQSVLSSARALSTLHDQETVILLAAPCDGTKADAATHRAPVLRFDDQRVAVLLNGWAASGTDLKDEAAAMVADAMIGGLGATAESFTADAAGIEAKPGTMKTSEPVPKTASIYHVSFTLLSADPSSVNASWDIAEATNRYLEPLRQGLDGLVELRVSSQEQYYVSLPAPLPNPSIDVGGGGGGGGYFYNESVLSRFLSLPSLKTSSPADEGPRLNFVVYVPPKEHTPLTLKLADGSDAAWNGFLAPGWGGIVIQNAAEQTQTGETAGGKGKNNSAKRKVPHEWVLDVDAKAAFEAFSYYLRELLNVPFLPYSASSMGNTIGVWERDRFMRRQLRNNVHTITDALSGLVALTREIQNMVIGDGIQSTILLATAQSSAVHLAAAAGDTVGAYMASKEGAAAAEQAFYDPSILGSLYFPQNEMYAVFLPALLPMFVAVLSTVKQHWESREKEDNQK
eukprot:gene7202-13475_t